jgi:hypothetical protein
MSQLREKCVDCVRGWRATYAMKRPMAPRDPFRTLKARLRWLGPRKRPRPKGGDAEREPVEPPRPNPLSGGAAAELEFDD